MSKRKKFGKVHISRMGYDLSKFYTVPRRKRERTEDGAPENREAALDAANIQGGRAQQVLTDAVDASIIQN